MNDHVVTRFAPSPTGRAHAGSYRTAMYAWLFARKHGGKFILRIEDTDTARNDKESELDIYEALSWLGLDYDEKYIQSENLARHQELLQKLIAENRAYISREEAKDGSGVMKDIIRFRNPNRVVTFHDLVRGEISTDTTDLGDFVIARNINEPLYHLAVVIDDHDEGVTHVIRAEEHIANIPRQILIIEALGWELPQYAHIPIVLGPDKQKLSKRKGALPMTEYAKRGYLQEAIFNAIAMIGWNPADPGSEQEIFSVPELISRFDFERVQKSAAVFNEEKLNWFNREYIKKLPLGAFIDYAKQFLGSVSLPGDMLISIAPLLQERISYFAELPDLIQKDFAFLLAKPVLDPSLICWKETSTTDTKQYLQQVISALRTIQTWDEAMIREAMNPLLDSIGKGPVLWPLRYGLTGQKSSPDPFTCANLLGRDETIARIEQTIAALP